MRGAREFITCGVLAVLVLFGASAVDPVTAAAGSLPAAAEQDVHEHAGGADDSLEHLEYDLAGTPMSEIEKQTAANAARIQKATGRRPGLAPFKANAVADPGVSGTWSPVVNTPVVPVFQAVLPNGKVLIWDSVGDDAAESYPTHNFTRVMLWNPVDNTYKRVDLQGTNIFCAGFAHLANGNILVAGGNLNSKLEGTLTTYVFVWQEERWSVGRLMAAGRWYPSVTENAQGEGVIVGGGPATAEVFGTDNRLRSLTGFTKYSARLYPFLGSRPDTQVGLYGPSTTGYTINTSGTGVVTATTTRDSINRDYGSFATYDVGRTLVVGGGNVTENGQANVPTKTSVMIDTNPWNTPVYTAAASMSTGRRQANATLLADGKVLVTGGMSTEANGGGFDLAHAVTAAEVWDPVTGQWTTLAGASRVRQYHSTAALLPDGRVITGGGGVCGGCVAAGYLEKNVEYFTPPYLYKKDGSGQLADRPVISGAPATVGINTAFTVTSPQAATVAKVALVGLSDVTHGQDQGQRYIPLRFSKSGTTLTVTGPQTGGVAPPGYYMLFIVGADGVPSVASMVNVGKNIRPLMNAVKNSTGRCLDVPFSSTTVETYLWTYDCNGGAAQSMTWLLNDRSIRVQGNCVDVPFGNYVAGQRVWTFSCNASNPQRWTFYRDGTIRPSTVSTVCLATASASNQAQVRLAACDGAALTKWTW
ncbi:galactose oxidase-like domain-containing protein [Actinoplanes sp. NPDC020271]|uniref:galactose oxidase-like domain-containing protein n=1 Tax=Actinoplanes sp. NPDC020271 TaxID=3363896 RepID=UPI00379F04B5